MADAELAKNNNLAVYSRGMAKACDEAEKWVKRNGALVRNEQEGLLKDLRHARRALRICEKAAGRKMCAGVFGPSQAGKSYLISALARGANNELLAAFADESKDFLSEINPEGGKESTGLVTRFTLTRPENLPAGYPVQIRLLSETDLVKIIANAYYADFEHKEQGKSDMAATLEQLKKQAGAPGASHIDLDAMEDLREYLATEFAAKPRVRDLERGYWNEAIVLGPELDLEGRVRLYSIIWDEVEEFTNLLRMLLVALESLDFPDEIYSSLDALVPREKSIIDVATLADLDKGALGNLDVCTPKGKKSSLPRAIVAALTAELTIVMRDKPAQYFEHTDLLDFPGYRSRYKLANPRKELAKEGMLKELFLRGKVAYLFQRYCAERELNSMLLCIGPSNQEVQDLPGVINSWVSTTHGQTPEERQGKAVSLIFVLTKFDMEFEDKKGAQGLGNRWDNRLKASLLNFFGQGYDWPTQWTPDHGFDNLYLLRNPNFKFDAVLSYKGDTETGIRPEREAFVNDLHAAFVGSQLVKNHFRDPEKSWEEAMRLNDGGISYIRESLAPLCDPEIKRQQLLQNIHSCCAGLERRLRAFYKSDDKDELRQQKMRLARKLMGSLGMMEEKKQRLGQLLHSFAINDSDIYDMYPEAVRRFRETGTEDNKEKIKDVPDEPAINMDDVDFEDWNPLASDDDTDEQSGANDGDEMDENAFYASYIESKWVENLHQLADNPDAQKFFMLDAKDFTALASELATGASRLGFKKDLADAFRSAAAYANTRKEVILRKQAAIAAQTINDYVDLLGFKSAVQEGKEHSITLPNGKSYKVFSPHKAIDGLPVLEETRSPYTRAWFRDWLNALAGLIMENVNFDGKQTINVAENTALGAIIKQFDKPLDNKTV